MCIRDRCVTGIDLIKEQIRIANGGELTFRQEDIRMTGHAIECRINAEIPERNFTPSAGRITDLHLPGGNGIRVDTAVYSGCEVLPYYCLLYTSVGSVKTAVRENRSCFIIAARENRSC